MYEKIFQIEVLISHSKQFQKVGHWKETWKDKDHEYLRYLYIWSFFMGNKVTLSYYRRIAMAPSSGQLVYPRLRGGPRRTPIARPLIAFPICSIFFSSSWWNEPIIPKPETVPNDDPIPWRHLERNIVLILALNTIKRLLRPLINSKQ